MKAYTWKDLINKTENELLVIKKEKQDDLYKVQNRKLVIVGNIMSLQGVIESEIREIPKEIPNE